MGEIRRVNVVVHDIIRRVSIAAVESNQLGQVRQRYDVGWTGRVHSERVIIHLEEPQKWKQTIYNTKWAVNFQNQVKHQ